MAGRMRRVFSGLLKGPVKEKPFFAGYPSKKTIVVSPVSMSKTGEKTVFEADFVRPRLGSQFAPLKDHHAAYALGIGAYQIANAAIRKFEKMPNVNLPLVEHSIKMRRTPTRDKDVLIQVKPAGMVKTGAGTEIRLFSFSLLDKADKKRVFGNGTLSIAVIKK